MDVLWRSEDKGLIFTWERGRQLATEREELAAKAKRGELPISPWKGGSETPHKGAKYAAYFYLAMWQGLRGEDLDIDTDQELTLVCAKTGGRTIFTGDAAKYGAEQSG